MKRVIHFLVDNHHDVRARWTLPEGEPPVVPPWMQQKVLAEGWRLEQRGETQGSGIAAHGHADWESVAANLATVLRMLLDETHEFSEQEANLGLEQAQAALDDYDVAVMEVSVAEPESAEEDAGGPAET